MPSAHEELLSWFQRAGWSTYEHTVGRNDNARRWAELRLLWRAINPNMAAPVRPLLGSTHTDEARGVDSCEMNDLAATPVV